MGMDANEIPDSIHWHEGLLLTPQHFQQLSLRQEALLRYNASMLSPFYWGIRHLKIDEPSLAKGEVRIKHVEAVMPDGLVVAHREGDGELLSLKFKDDNETKSKRQKVYLVVSVQSRDTSRGERTRYRETDGEPVADELTGEGQMLIPRLVPHLQLRADDRSPQNFVSLPLLEVEYKTEGYVQTDYIPPLLIVTSKPRLGLQTKLRDRCGAIADMVRYKAQELAGRLDPQSPRAAIDPDLETRNRIRSLTATLPYLEAMLYTETSHPYPLYLALCSMAGQLAGLGTKPVPNTPYYIHDDPYAAFEPLLQFIEQAIREGLSSPYEAFVFTYQEGVYQRRFRTEWKHRRTVLSLRAQPGVATEEMVNWGRTCLIGSEGHLRAMMEKRILGAKRTHIEGDEDLAASRGVVLFLLSGESEFIEPDKVLQIFNRSEHEARPVEIVLHVRKAAAAKVEG
ncbi:MAG: type secretion system protein ImpJ [Pyrinomonadaceae bacterium]|jgi:type VI secretion system protein ImpJ|nr:type secretion system protein ImpJ [Pyrinomonadaceae bacterium]